MDRRDFVSGVDEFALASRVATAQEKEIVKTAPSADKNQKATNMLNKTRSIVECRRCELSMRLPRLRRIDSMMLGAALVSFCVVVSAQGIKGAAIATKAGNWTVYRSLDPINDKVTCTGVLKGDVKAQLSENILFIPVSGGMQSVTLRFGEGSANPLRLPQKMEKEIRSIILEGSDFSSAVESKRIRGQVLTLVSGVFTFDLDLIGVQEALESIRSNCTVQPEPVVQSVKTAAPAVATEKEASPNCSEKLLARMKEAKLSPKQITTICAP